MKLNEYIDHTALAANATDEELQQLYEEARSYGFKSVCVEPSRVAEAHGALSDSEVLVCTVIGFPLGQNTTEVKVFEAKNAIENGADELDMVLNVADLQAGRNDRVRNEIKKLKEVAGDRILKVILEISFLSDEEIRRASLLAKEAGADFVKTSTGFSEHGATVEAVALMRETVGPEMGVKASGGIRDYATAKAMIEAGASRIGASKSVAIMEGAGEVRS
ncbi:MAG: deoxyribose-phosphate aldolase [Tissierellia bacterium]|nr:deoxyribose-phosphate aldolase [Tissierellia bacterium]